MSARKDEKMNSSYKEIWNIILDSLSKKYSEDIMNLWFNNFELVHLDESSAFIVTDEAGFVDLLNKRYAGQISSVFKDVLGFDVDVKIFYKKTFSLDSAKAALQNEKHAKIVSEPVVNREKSDDVFFESKNRKEQTDEPDSAYTFKNFIVGSSNKFAYAASVAIAEHPYANENNPLFIYGASGLGKTHLMKAIANEVSSNHPEYKIIFVTGEDFTNEFVDSLMKKTTAKFKEKYRNVDMLFIDDIQLIASKEQTQEEFFHTFNALYNSHKQIVMTSDKLPNELQGLEKRLVTRFEGGLLADIQPPDTELRIAIFKSKAMAMHVDIPDEVLTYIAENTKSNVRQIEGVIKRLGAYSFINGVPITIENAKNLLSGIITGPMPPEVIAENVIKRVSEFYNIPVNDIKSKRRTKEIAQARHVSIYVINHVTSMTLENIGKIFGRDHSTVLSSITVVNTQIKQNASFEHDINNLIKEFST